MVFSKFLIKILVLSLRFFTPSHASQVETSFSMRETQTSRTYVKVENSLNRRLDSTNKGLIMTPTKFTRGFNQASSGRRRPRRPRYSNS